MKQISIFLIALMLISTRFQAQEITQEDYSRAISFIYDNYNNKTAFNLYTNVNWFKDGSGLWFIDFSKNNLHLIGYSSPLKKILKKSNLISICLMILIFSNAAAAATG